MPEYLITAPDGRKFKVTAPEGASQDEVLRFTQEQMAGTAKPQGSLQDIVGEAMTFGLTHEASGLARAAGPGLRAVGQTLGIPGVEYKEGEAGQAYSQGRDASINRNRAYRDANPWSAFGGDVVGGITNPLMRLLPMKGSTATRTALKSGATGAGVGAAYGFNTSPGDVWDRAEGAAAGSVVGGTVGLAAPPLITAGGKALQYLGDQATRKMGPLNQQSVAARKIMEALQRDGLTPDQALQRVQELGPNAALMDAGPNSQALAASIARAPGQGKTALDNFVTARQEGTRDPNNVLLNSQTQRVQEGIDALVPDRVDATRRVTQAQRTAAGRNYENARADPVNNLVDIAPLVKSLDDEIAASKGSIRDGLVKVRGLLVDKDGNPEVTIDTLHQAKMAIDDFMTGEARGSIGRVARGRIADYQNQLLGAIENSGPAGLEYATGRGATRAAWQVDEALDRGTAFMNRAEFANPKELKGALAKMNADELHAFRMGAAQALKGKLAELVVRADATKRVMDIPALEAKIQLAFGNDRIFKQYIDLLKNERTMFDTYAAIKGNSKTAERMAADADLNKDPGGVGSSLVHLATNPAKLSNWGHAGLEMIRNMGSKLSTPPQVRNEIGGLLTSQGPWPPLAQAMRAQGLSQRRRDLLQRGLLGSGAITGPGLLDLYNTN